ncbi:pseudouridine synthase [Lapidilactobacillus achengensis]|uniref:Pseudouridine synthase n=1 Tax=Lapidilactobacillus achengensis TaxID=2486000 RepID=A0ABW1USL5_9LACO|nr:pseudouridine synthase [Lapidilactobacillus achengensis]
MRIDRYLANMGQGSRQEVRALLKQKVVTVNGQVVKQAGQQVTPTDLVAVAGRPLAYTPFGYYLLNKPAGVLTATIDPHEATVLELLAPTLPHYRELAPVGRLDRDTTGLLLITNDGQLAHRLLQPKYHVAKRYLATVSGLVQPELSAIFAQGVKLSDFTTQPAQLEILAVDTEKKQSTVALTIAEGKYHQVKRMLTAFDHPVLQLQRQSFGPLTLPADLSSGAYRELTAAELVALQASAAETSH